MMHDVLVDLLVHGGVTSERPWIREQVKFIAPVPGYDRHFTMLAHLGIEMVPVPMNADGPDVAACRELVKDPTVRGLWVVPTYADPRTDPMVRHQIAMAFEWYAATLASADQGEAVLAEADKESPPSPSAPSPDPAQPPR